MRVYSNPHRADLAIIDVVSQPVTQLFCRFRIRNGAVSSTEHSLSYVGLGGIVVSRIAQIYDIYQSGKNATDISSGSAVRMQPNLGYDDASDQLMYGVLLTY